MTSFDDGDSLAGLGDAVQAAARNLEVLNGDIPKPGGLYAAQMTGPGAWPESNESEFSDRETELTRQIAKLDTAIYNWEIYRARTFNGDLVWSGTSATVANGAVDLITLAMKQRRGEIFSAKQSCGIAASSVKGVKTTILTAVQNAQDQIRDKQGAASDTYDPTSDIEALVNNTFFANVGSVDDAAKLLGGPIGPPRTPPFPAKPPSEGPSGEGSGDDEAVQYSSASYTNYASDGGAEETSPESVADYPVKYGSASAVQSQEPFGESLPVEESTPESLPLEYADNGIPAQQDGGAQNGTGITLQPAAGQQTNHSRSQQTSTTSNSASASNASAGLGSAPSSGSGQSSSGAWGDFTDRADSKAAEAAIAAQPQGPANPLEAFLQGYSEAEPSVNPASGGEASTAAPAQTAPVAPDPTNASTPPAGHSPSGVPGGAGNAAPVGSGGPLHAGSSMSGGGMGMPLAPPPTVSPAAPAPVAPAPAAPMPPPAAAAAAPAPVPVSAARRERDAIAAAGRRGNDPARVAVRIAAALNATPTQDFGFYWVTGLTVDGTIVVANSYGVGFIPQGVTLPERVKMASADDSISAVDRGRWATYPMLTLQGWAEQHSTALRIVIATESQFQGFDPGAAKVVLQPDDIPDTGAMQGRSRLEVIAPAAAARLAGVTDAALPELLPAAPADLTRPADETFSKWFEVMKPMMSQADERGQVHLRAFIEFANYAQERAVYAAHTAADPVASRAAIAEWIYWQHLGVLTSDALAELQPS